MHTILGAGGPVANSLWKTLIENKEQVRLVSRRPIEVTGQTQWTQADLLDFPQVTNAVEGSDIIYLCAGTGYHIVWVGLLMAGITLGVQAWATHEEKSTWQTMVFTVLSLAQLGHVLAIRSERESLYSQGLFSNFPLFGAVLLTFLLQLGVIYLPFANDLFKTQPLSLLELLICVGAAAIVFHAVELEKWFKRRRTPNP